MVRSSLYLYQLQAGKEGHCQQDAGLSSYHKLKCEHTRSIFSSRKIHSLGRNIWHCPWPIEQISSDEFVVSPTYNRKDGSGAAALVTTVSQKFRPQF